MNSTLSFALKALVSATLMGWLVWQEDPARISRLASQADLGMIVMAFGLYLLAITAGAYKWGLLLAAQGVNVPLFALARSTFVGLFFGTFLPTNVGGDVVRAFDLAQTTENGPLASASVIVDRLSGLMVFIGSAAVMGLVAIMWLGEPRLWGVALAAGVLFVACLVVFAALLSRRVSRLARIVFLVIPRLNPLRATARRVAESFHAYRGHLDAVAWAATISFGIQCLTSVVNWLIGQALHLSVPFVYYFVFNPLVAVVLLLPVTINGIGLKQAVYVFFYATLTGRIDESQALTLSLMFHAVIIGSGLLGGLFWLHRRSLRSRALSGEIHESPISQS